MNDHLKKLQFLLNKRHYKENFLHDFSLKNYRNIVISKENTLNIYRIRKRDLETKTNGKIIKYLEELLLSLENFKEDQVMIHMLFYNNDSILVFTNKKVDHLLGILAS